MKTFQLIPLLVLITFSIPCFGQNVEVNSDTLYVDAITTINRAYSLPNNTGINGQIMTTDGSGQSAWASLPTSTSIGTYVYLVPYICGYKFPGTFPMGASSTRSEGQYLTSIMINNPAHDTAFINRNVTLLDAGDFTPPISGLVQAPFDTLAIDIVPRFHSLELTCPDIDGMMGGGLTAITPPIDGKIILESSEKISVTAVFTYFGISLEIEPINQGGGLGIGQGQSIDIEQIVPIFIPADL